MGLCMYHENRYQGKAVYCLDLETLNYNPNEISGLNTTKKLPYEIMVKSNASKSYAGKSEMHVFQLYDAIIKFDGDGYVSVLGRT